jgi:hypothetical protein
VEVEIISEFLLKQQEEKKEGPMTFWEFITREKFFFHLFSI